MAAGKQRVESARVAVLERHYTPDEIAQAWAVHKNTVIRTFQDLPGVLKLGTKNITLRIPETVLMRVQRERSR